MTKTCIGCGEAKPIEDFPEIKSRGKVYRRRSCLTCRRAHEDANRERLRANNRKSWRKNAEKWNARRAEQYRQLTPEQRKALTDRDYQRKYGISREDQMAMLAAQGGKCAVPGCGATEPGAHNWATDHDHACCPGNSRSCGQCIRGILCNHCNIMLGFARDNPAILAGAIEYLSAQFRAATNK